MAKYKRDCSKRITVDTRFHIPWSGVEGESHNNTVVTFPAYSDYAFIKRELRKVLMVLGCNRNEAKTATKAMFPELFA